MKYQEKSTLSSPDDTMLPEVYTDTVALSLPMVGSDKSCDRAIKLVDS